ncbi:nucleotidyl transferase AbiEii/AbiGii toxin family protein [Streptomyces diacarni]|uniref:nucleotidyl transferase AbiEii/AbiGii toxin family protein n=1 Tax=Streptomyces diacarni TaxID=2800381 RepID=UPI001FEBC371|nr:nucleotidyl transferase AbiEii/AbiGii toxin family protein [Streptomyces diacarni]
MSDTPAASAHTPAAAVAPPAFAGEFEIHLTVDAACPGVASGALAAYAAQRAWKYARIVLDRGRAPDQPMVTLAADGGLDAVRERARAAARELADAGAPVVRVKIEAAPWASGVPRTDDEGAALGRAYYFEHHVKLLLPPEAHSGTGDSGTGDSSADSESARLARLVVRHDAHLSRNARRTRADGRREYFVTQRCREVGDETAGRRLNDLLASLSSLRHPILATEREFVVHDSAEALDEGWIAEEGAAVTRPRAYAATGWRKFGPGPWAAQETVPQRELDEETRAALELPRTLRPVLGGEHVVQRPVFDPSAAHHAKAMRLGDPEFAEAERGERWYAARRRALDLALAAVASSGWAEHLVLRGSVLLRAWYAEAARDPGDLDFVVEPSDWQVTDERTERMLDQLAHAAEAASHAAEATSPAAAPHAAAAPAACGAVRLDADHAARDEIWTYDRVPGRRLVIPWTAEGLPGGTVQLDFVFNEPLPAPAVRTRIPCPAGAAGEPLTVRAASRGLSLAWKLLWLVSDAYPEGKDLYDAILLAEDPSVALPFETFRAVFRDVEYGLYDRNPVLLGDLAYAAQCVEWFEFAKEHPHLAGPPDFAHDAPPADWVDRLTTALAPTFAADDGSGAPASHYQLSARWLAPLVAQCRTAFADGGLTAVLERLFATHVPPRSALVVVREVLGSTRHTVDGVLPLVAAFRPPPDPDRPWRRDGWDEERLREAADALRERTQPPSGS